MGVFHRDSVLKVNFYFFVTHFAGFLYETFNKIYDFAQLDSASYEHRKSLHDCSHVRFCLKVCEQIFIFGSSINISQSIINKVLWVFTFERVSVLSLLVTHYNELRDTSPPIALISRGLDTVTKKVNKSRNKTIMWVKFRNMLRFKILPLVGKLLRINKWIKDYFYRTQKRFNLRQTAT